MQSVLKISNISKSFGWRKKICVVDDVSFNVEKGEILVFLGANGAGKTTIAKIASGLIIPDKGSVLIDGKDPNKYPDLLRNVGTVLEGNRNLFWRLTAAENLMYFAVLKKKKIAEIPKKVNEVLEKFDLIDKRNVQVRKLSRGMQQRLAIAKCWLHNPTLVILDEPALGLDIFSRNELLNRIIELKKDGVGIILTTHNFEIAERISDKILIIDKGRIVKTATKSNILEEFASKKYIVELDGKLNSNQIECLIKDFNLEFEKNKLVFNDEFKKIFDIISVIEPLSVRSINRKEMDLSEIFKQIIRKSIL